MKVLSLRNCWTGGGQERGCWRRNDSSSRATPLSFAAAALDANMNLPLPCRNAALESSCDHPHPRDENGNCPGVTCLTSDPAPTSRETRHRRFQRQSAKEMRTFRTTSALAGTETDMTGHVNALFCCDDEKDYFSGPISFRLDNGRQIGVTGEQQGHLQDVTDLHFFGPSGLLVTDFVGSRLQVYSEGAFLQAYTPTDVVEPWSSAVTRRGSVAISSRRNKKVFLLDPSTCQVMGSVGQGHLSCPSGVAVTPGGLILVTDFERHKVLAFAEDTGALVRQLTLPGKADSGGGCKAATSFSQPRYVTVSPQPAGDVVVSDSGNHRLVVFDRDLRYLRTVGRFGTGDGCLKFPHAACGDAHGNLYVCDRYNDRVSAFTARGEFLRHVLTFSEHRLRHPQGLALSEQEDSLFVSHGAVKAHSVSMFKLLRTTTS